MPLLLAEGGRWGCSHKLLAPTRQWRQEARVSSRSLFLRDSLRRAREPPRPPSALSWRSSPSAAAGGSPRRTQGLRGRALGGVAPAGWLRLRQLSPARRADRARRPAGSAGAAPGQDPLCAEQRANVPRARRLPQGLPPPPRENHRPATHGPLTKCCASSSAPLPQAPSSRRQPHYEHEEATGGS